VRKRKRRDARRVDSLGDGDVAVAVVDVGLDVSRVVGDDLWYRSEVSREREGNEGKGRTVKPS
jgi:hypothetical protein